MYTATVLVCNGVRCHRQLVVRMPEGSDRPIHRSCVREIRAKTWDTAADGESLEGRDYCPECLVNPDRHRPKSREEPTP